MSSRRWPRSCPTSSARSSRSHSGDEASASTCCSRRSARRVWSPTTSGPTPTCASRCVSTTGPMLTMWSAMRCPPASRSASPVALLCGWVPTNSSCSRPPVPPGRYRRCRPLAGRDRRRLLGSRTTRRSRRRSRRRDPTDRARPRRRRDHGGGSDGRYRRSPPPVDRCAACRDPSLRCRRRPRHDRSARRSSRSVSATAAVGSWHRQPAPGRRGRLGDHHCSPRRRRRRRPSFTIGGVASVRDRRPG